MQKRDQEMLRRLIASDREAFRLLYEQYEAVLSRYLRYRLHDDDLVRDILQEAFDRLWSHRETLREELALFPYLMRISANLVSDFLRHRRVERRYEEEYQRSRPPGVNETELAVNAGLLEERIRGIVNEQLPERCRLIFLLSRMEGKTNEEIAELLGVSIKTVENQMSKALAILRNFLADDLGRT